jgi:hypothetical protein
MDSKFFHKFTRVSSVFVGNSIGELGQIDLRNKKLVGQCQGMSGSVTSIACHNGKMVCTSMDRFARVYHETNRELIQKVNFPCLII